MAAQKQSPQKSKSKTSKSSPSSSSSSSSSQKQPSAATDKQQNAFVEQAVRAGMPFAPSLSVAFRIIILVRVMGAMHSSNINDCDEVFNYWEPLHYLVNGVGFQTWEYAPQYSLRSWAYLMLYAIPASIVSTIFPFDKRPTFFIVRLLQGLLSSYVEAKFYRSIADNVNIRIARYTLAIMVFSAGMWNASTALLPNTLSMHLNMLGLSYAMQPPTSSGARIKGAVLSFAASAILGWPFAILIAVPYVIEEVTSFSRLPSSASPTAIDAFTTVIIQKYQKFGRYAILGAHAFGLPTLLLDYFFYGRWTFSTLNILFYNLAKGGDDLYGTEPTHFYLSNLILNFNVCAVLAVLSIPVLLVSQYSPIKILNMPLSKGVYKLIYIRLLPLYLWFGVLSTRAHKEERFGFPAYPLVAFAAGTTLYAARSWLETGYVMVTKAPPYRAARSTVLSTFTLSVLVLTAVVSISRILALRYYYYAPVDLTVKFQYAELARRAVFAKPENYPELTPSTLEFVTQIGDRHPWSNEQDIHLDALKKLDEEIENYPGQVDLDPLESLNLTVCYQDEWYRFPSHFLFPAGVNIEFVKPTSFNGLMPKKWPSRRSPLATHHHNATKGISLSSFPLPNPSNILSRAEAVQQSTNAFNDQNKEINDDRFVPASSCDYLFHVMNLHREETNTINKDVAFNPKTWTPVLCKPFLDAAYSAPHSRWFWVPHPSWQDSNVYGHFCIHRKN